MRNPNKDDSTGYLILHLRKNMYLLEDNKHSNSEQNVELVVEFVVELVFELVVEPVDFGECEPDGETAGELFCGLLLEVPLLGGLAAGEGAAAGEFPGGEFPAGAAGAGAPGAADAAGAAGVPSDGEPGSNGTPLITLNSPENFSPLPSLITNIYTPGVTLTFHCLLNLERSSESSIETSSLVSLLRIFKEPAIVGVLPSIDQVIVNVAVVERVPVGVLTTTSIV
ncbi:hypothetical protein C2G38_2033224 [Gigaspora rosea]|uniref:Uncharacterized protein n=1 Tax=Gigaspora rosea TaxID=44941 RepID=A0A397VPC7_9GLOM|nr:hypothetical protein C2G38_2033224 [Gigaspora rosea]